VARILVADDNSNIQKMVGLALKDQGIDVIAVGNGEAAVRKIADLRPDLVLADVFMPVRNGYEVCKFVKDDSSLAHIPVILLVGAFDPLDEQEAQRVGADGVLKKPFVPPDPLISMVKSALQRASAAQTAAGITEKAAVPVMAGGPSTAGRASSTPAASVSPTVFAAPREQAPVESFVEEVPATPETLKIESGGKPLAFGSLLETPAAEPDDAAFVAPPNPELADRDWSAAETDEVEEEEEESASSSWRRDGGSEDFAPDPAGEAAADKATARAKRRESWTPTREKTQDLLEEATAPEIIVAPKPSVSYGAPVPQNSFAAPKPEPPLEPKKIEEVPAPRSVEIAPPVIAKAPEPAAPETAKPSGGNSWFSTTNSPWEAEAQKANQLASGWDAPPAPAASSASKTVAEETAAEEPALPEPAQLEAVQAEAAPTYDFVSEAPSEEPVHYVPEPELVQNEVVAHSPLPDLISDGSISPETVESIRQETSYALESVTQTVAKKPAESAVKIAEASQKDMDALVANVLAKMSPEMLQAVTREILKPVVAAMIRDEINAKKS
jgi:CheY-like chemotaxis protein/transcription termination factor NusB